MKIRFINANEPVTTFYRDLIPALLEAGHEVEVFVSSAQYREKRGFEELFANDDRVSICKMYAGPLKKYNQRASKAMAHGLFAVHGFFKMLFGKKVDLSVYLTQPPFYYLTAKIIQSIRGTKFYVVVMDLQPDEYVEFGMLKRDGWLTNWLERRTVNAFKAAKGIIVIGRCMADIVQRKGVLEKKIHFIPNWTTETSIQPVDAASNPLRAKMGWEESFVITYGGNIGHAQNFSDFIEAAAELSSHKNIVFCLIGGGSRFDEIAKIKSDRELTNLVLLPFMHDEYTLSEIYGSGDVNFISLRPNCTGLGVPSKAYVSLAAGRPIIFQGSPDSEIARLVTEENVGIAVETKDQLKEAILDMCGNDAKRKQFGVTARLLSDTKYSTESSCKKYIDTLCAD